MPKLMQIASALLLLLVTGPEAAHADPIRGPEHYLEIELKVRELTLQGMRARLELLQRPAHSVEQEVLIDRQTRLAILDVYTSHRTTAGAHLAYGTKHAQEIRAWLEVHPAQRDRSARLGADFTAVSNQLDALRGQP